MDNENAACNKHSYPGKISPPLVERRQKANRYSAENEEYNSTIEEYELSLAHRAVSLSRFKSVSAAIIPVKVWASWSSRGDYSVMTCSKIPIAKVRGAGRCLTRPLGRVPFLRRRGCDREGQRNADWCVRMS